MSHDNGALDADDLSARADKTSPQNTLLLYNRYTSQHLNPGEETNKRAYSAVVFKHGYFWPAATAYHHSAPSRDNKC